MKSRFEHVKANAKKEFFSSNKRNPWCISNSPRSFGDRRFSVLWINSHLEQVQQVARARLARCAAGADYANVVGFVVHAALGKVNVVGSLYDVREPSSAGIVLARRGCPVEDHIHSTVVGCDPWK